MTLVGLPDWPLVQPPTHEPPAISNQSPPTPICMPQLAMRKRALTVPAAGMAAPPVVVSFAWKVLSALVLIFHGIVLVVPMSLDSMRMPWQPVGSGKVPVVVV